MSNSYIKLISYLQQKGILLDDYTHYLTSLEEYERLNSSLQGRGISLREYHRYLEQVDSPSVSPHEVSFGLLENFGKNFLARNATHLGEMNQWLKENESAVLKALGTRNEKSILLQLLQYLFRVKKITVDEFLFWTQFSQETKTIPISSYRLEKSKTLEFSISGSAGKHYGSYLILEELGRGGMGIVYKAYHQGLHRIVALKVLRVGEKASELLLNRFRREIEIMAQLQHPGIVQIYDSGMEGQEVYLAMEYVQGKALSESEKNLTLREKLLLMQQMLEALHYAHQQKILHRDLKLENILLTVAKEPKIADFGLAKSLKEGVSKEQLTRTGVLIGTVPYMAPELARSESGSLDTRTDIYAVGVCLYRLLTYQYPFEARTIPETLNKILTQEPPLPSSLKKEIHTDLDFIILKALEKEKEKRYASAQLMAEDLARFLAGYSIQSSYSTLQQQWRRHWKKYRWGFVFGLLLVGFFLFSWTFLSISRYRVRIQERDQYHQQAQKLVSTSGTGSVYELLNALQASNQALWLDEEDLVSQQIKWEIGERLLKQAYLQERYPLASYIIEEMKEIRGVSDIKKKDLQGQFVKECEKIKTQHFKQLRKYIIQLESDPFNETLEKDAIFEIAKMNEPEVHNILLEILRDGNRYSLQQTVDEKKIAYYILIVRMVGRTGNHYFAEELFQAAELLSQQLIPLSERDRALFKSHYLVELVEALANLKALHFADPLVQIRIQMGTTGLMWSQTTRAFKKLLVDSSLFTKSLENGKDFFESANRKMQQGNYAGALQDYSRSIELDPSYPQVFTNRGLLKHLFFNDPQGAIQDFTQAITIAPFSVEAYVNRGATKESILDLDGAIRDLDRAIQLNPNLFEAYNARGSVYKRKKEYVRAYQDYSDAIRCNPKSAVVYSNRAFVLTNLGKWDLGLLDANRAIELDPKYAKAYYCRATIYFQINRWQESLKDFNQSIALNPQYAEPYHSRALLKEGLKDIDGAIQDYTTMISMNPKSGESYCSRGYLKHKKGNFVEALEDFNQSAQLSPDYAMLYFLRGKLFQDMKQFSSAKQDFKEFLLRTHSLQGKDLTILHEDILRMYPELHGTK